MARYIHTRQALPRLCDQMRSSWYKKKNIVFVTLCSSQGTAGATPGDRTLRASRRGGETALQLGWRARPDGQGNVVFSKKVILPRKEVIQPHVPVRLPCYDFTPLTLHTFGASPLAVGPATSGADDSGGVTGGVYKARERIHRGVLIRDY